MTDGRQYIATQRLYRKSGDGKLFVVAEPGETCERVSPQSLGWLLAQGRIVAAPSAPADDPTEAPAVSPGRRVRRRGSD
jgi:hypothetical protein